MRRRSQFIPLGDRCHLNDPRKGKASFRHPIRRTASTAIRQFLASVQSVCAVWLGAWLIIIAISPGPAQAIAAPQDEEVMTNQTIIVLVKEKTGDGLIISLIQQSKTKFDTSPKAVIELKKAGVSDAVIQAMMAKGSGQRITVSDSASGVASPNSSEGTSSPPTGLPTEIGVYVKKKDQWVEILPEVINWQTGGVLKSIATLGIVKGDINGRILNPHSPNSIVTPVEFLIITPEGVAITEYQFLKLREKRDVREFRTVTGGVFHQSGGARRDLQPFEGKKIAPRTHTITFQTLSYGEYGFLPPGAYTSASASAQLGKMYTFRVVE